MPKLRQPVVHFPSELARGDYVGPLYGFYHMDSNEYNVTGWGEQDSESERAAGTVIGRIVSQDDQAPEGGGQELVGVRAEEGLLFSVGRHHCRNEAYDLLQQVFSRNTGILETDLMLKKSAIISGCGSVGSMVALELARAGVGTFVLIDHDVLDYHNICRHQCDIRDVGKFKVSAVRERILQINSSARVITSVSLIEEVPKETFDTFCVPGCLIIGCADNREGDLYANSIACLYNIPFVSIGFWERAFAGEVFYCLPGEMPCYACTFGQEGGISGRKSTNRRFYTNQEDLAKVNFPFCQYKLRQ